MGMEWDRRGARAQHTRLVTDTDSDSSLLMMVTLFMWAGVAWDRGSSTNSLGGVIMAWNSE